MIFVCQKSAFMCNHCLSPLESRLFDSHPWKDVLDTMLCDKVCQSAGRWFSSATLVEHQYIAEKLLKISVNLHIWSRICEELWDWHIIHCNLWDDQHFVWKFWTLGR